MSKTNSPKIVFVEDDPDQMELLIQFALDEISQLAEHANTSNAQKELLHSIKLLKVTNVGSLKQAVTKYQDIFLVVLDCNIPDDKDGESNDQLVKANHRITGNHNAVDVIIEHLPNAAITLISSMNRFRKIVYEHYASDENVEITFISKSDQEMIQRNLAYYLRRYIRQDSQ